jgi:hypothetical protein
MSKEKLLNNYYNIGGYNRPSKIGYMMNIIRKAKPITEDEWKVYYLSNVHDESYLESIALEMKQSIPKKYNINLKECRDYIYDVMFRRTFQGYNRENQALKLLKKHISPDVKEAPKDWDTEYFIDFFIETSNNQIIGIQLKPETFYLGHYQNIVDIKGKMELFRKKFNALTYILKYKHQRDQSKIIFSNPDLIDEIKAELN